jgi:hypothetical protein
LCVFISVLLLARGDDVWGWPVQLSWSTATHKLIGGAHFRPRRSILFISEKTVKSHVGNILSKLHLDDRTQAAVYAWRQGFMKAE